MLKVLSVNHRLAVTMRYAIYRRLIRIIYLGYFCGRAFSVIQGIRMANSEITRISFTTTECRSTIIMISKFWFFITKKQLHITYNSRTSKYIIVNKGWTSVIVRGLFQNNLGICFYSHVTTDLSIKRYWNEIEHLWNKIVSYIVVSFLVSS